MKSPVAPTAVELMPVTVIQTVLVKYLKPREGLVIAEQKKFVAFTQKNGESSGDFLVKLLEATRFCEFENLKTIAVPEACTLRVHFVAGSQNSEHKMKILEYHQNKLEPTIDNILSKRQPAEKIDRTGKKKIGQPKVGERASGIETIDLKEMHYLDISVLRCSMKVK